MGGRGLVVLATFAVAGSAGFAAPAAARAPGRPDAEIFATSNRATITDPDDRRLRARLVRFDREVRRLIRRGGGVPRASRLLDGVFWSSERGRATFERSRDFDVDSVSERELHAIAERVRRRFRQESVLTFDYLRRDDPRVDAIELEVAGVDARGLRDALAADPAAQRRLVGGSVALHGRLVLVAGRADSALARRVVERAGGDPRASKVRYGRREFVG